MEWVNRRHFCLVDQNDTIKTPGVFLLLVGH
jgi:hypothetical protein